ncbi:YwaF family protein [Gelidibacter maritimus]|uniref:TIGR02206 family membrane protein n=1 Tax=Gelidibacter maritimus TaxID=2761487 RepID=A0A7W2M6V1_9FLAO|nr:TIGR02206 family membrane protein [Gelidibacter maritimus]MBA6153770.1 TIGR02206 family membrane protein [Gelidibacter maritimus]
MQISVLTVPLAVQRVVMGSIEHWLPIIFASLVGFVTIRYAKNNLLKNEQHRLIHFIAIGISITVISFHLHKVIFEDYDLQKDLPLYLCSLLAILIPIFTWYRKFWMYEVLVFWVIAGTLQAVITPDIASGFPTFNYFRYWVVHLGLLFVIGYATIVLRMTPNFKSVFKSFFVLQLYFLTIMLVNHLLNANYFYLSQKPKSASLLDYFGEWPMYIIVVQVILLPYFLLIYVPFYLYNRERANKIINKK